MKYLTPTEFAQRLNVATVTVRKWAQKGILKPITTPGGHRRYTIEELERFSKEYNLPYQKHNDGEFRVLIVDDDHQLRKYLFALLTESFKSKIAIDEAEDGFAVGNKIHTFKPDVVLLDLLMPEMNGFEVCQLIKSQESTQSIRIIAMTGYYVEDNIEKIIEAGAEACIKKPINREKLIEALNFHAQYITL